jgi:DNA-binding MarR family transcriptional regulator
VLWEIRPSGSAIAGLRDRLGLDSGYLSRLLRALEGDGLIEVVPDTHDRRSRIAADRARAGGARNARCPF